jgi:hypothetical protein
LANITALLAIGLIVGALAGSVMGVMGVPAVVTGGVSLQASGGSDPGSHGSCVSSFVHHMLGQMASGQSLGQLVSVMARRC